MIKSCNNNILCKPYVKKGGIRSTTTKGIATIDQRTKIVGLEVVEDAYINEDLTISKGSVVYIKEEILHSTPQYNTPMICDDLKESCVLVNYGHVSFVNIMES